LEQLCILKNLDYLNVIVVLACLSTVQRLRAEVCGWF